MRLLDLFCGAGGAAMGYHRAGFEVVGVDNRPQKHYPFEFHQADAFEYLAEHGQEFDVIHASPPCQAYSVTRSIHGYNYPDRLGTIRQLLMALDRPWVIENVVGAPINTVVELCGVMFGLHVYRHRRFESNVMLMQPSHQPHPERVIETGKPVSDGQYMVVAGHFANLPYAHRAMGMPFQMTAREMAQAIPPAYTTFIGQQLLSYLRAAARQPGDFFLEHKSDTSAFLDPDSHVGNKNDL